MLKPTVLVTV